MYKRDSNSSQVDQLQSVQLGECLDLHHVGVDVALHPGLLGDVHLVTGPEHGAVLVLLHVLLKAGGALGITTRH